MNALIWYQRQFTALPQTKRLHEFVFLSGNVDMLLESLSPALQNKLAENHAIKIAN